MPTRKRILTKSSGAAGGVSPIIAVVEWGPDFGDQAGNDGISHHVGVNMTMPALGLGHTRTVGVNVDLQALAATFPTIHNVGVNLTGTALGAPFWMTLSTVESADSGAAISIAKPSGTISGDFLLAIIGHSGQAESATPNAADGWTAILNQTSGGVTGTTRIWAWRKFAGSSEPSSYSFTLSSEQAFIGQIHRIAGVDTTTPVDVSGGSSGSATDPVAPSITTTVSNVLKVAACAQGNTLNADYTPPANYVERSDQNGGGLLGALAVTGETATRVQAAAGASGTATMDSTQLVASNYAAIHVAIRPGPVILA